MHANLAVIRYEVFSVCLLAAPAFSAPSKEIPPTTLGKRDGNCLFQTWSNSTVAVPGPDGVGGGPIVQNGYFMVQNNIELTITNSGCGDQDCNYGQQFALTYEGLSDTFLYQGGGDEAGCPSSCDGAYGSQSALAGVTYSDSLSLECGCRITFDC